MTDSGWCPHPKLLAKGGQVQAFQTVAAEDPNVGEEPVCDREVIVDGLSGVVKRVTDRCGICDQPGNFPGRDGQLDHYTDAAGCLTGDLNPSAVTIFIEGN